MRCKKRPHSGPGGTAGRGANSKRGNAVAESENIVAETAEKIFADLADAQTINSDKNGSWKAPLWQALTESGLPLSWVPDDLRRLRRQPRRRFYRAEFGRALCRLPCRWPRPCWRDGCWRRPKIASPEGEMTVAPASPRDRITLNADGTLVRPRPRRALRQGRKAYRRARRRRRAACRSRWSMPPPSGSRRASGSAATPATP